MCFPTPRHAAAARHTNLETTLDLARQLFGLEQYHARRTENARADMAVGVDVGVDRRFEFSIAQEGDLLNEQLMEAVPSSIPNSQRGTR